MGGTSLGPVGVATTAGRIEVGVRFYMAYAFAELTGRQAENAMRRLQEEPLLWIIEAIDEVIQEQMNRQDHDALLGWAIGALETRQQESGLESYDNREHIMVYQEVKNWAVVTSQDEATAFAIQHPYMLGLKPSERETAEFVWQICDNLTEGHKDILHEIVRNSPTNMTFRAA